MTIASEITRINNNIADAYTAASNKGATLPATLNSNNLATCIGTISTSSSPVINSLNITPSTSSQTITASGGVDGYSPINVSAVDASIDANITAGNIKNGVSILGVTGTYEGGSSGRYKLLDIVKDDNNNSIGTVSGFFTDSNNIEYAVVCLNYRYRGSGSFISDTTSIITNLPVFQSTNLYVKSSNSNTATQNTQLILDYCVANNYNSAACTHCRSQSFLINGVTYYGQLPNMIELINIFNYANIIDQNDGATGVNSLLQPDYYWSSNQNNLRNAWQITPGGSVSTRSKSTGGKCTVILEIPNT